jgi:hypothetical protein
MVRMYEPAVCCGRSGEGHAWGASFGSGEWSRRKIPRKGTLGVLLFGGAGDCEYTEEPLIMFRRLLWSAPKREGDWSAGVPNGSWVWSWSGRGDHAKSGDRNIAIRVWSCSMFESTKIKTQP